MKLRITTNGEKFRVQAQTQTGIQFPTPRRRLFGRTPTPPPVEIFGWRDLAVNGLPADRSWSGSWFTTANPNGNGPAVEFESAKKARKWVAEKFGVVGVGSLIAPAWRPI